MTEKEQIKQLEASIQTQRFNYIIQYRQIMSELISTTPTSELREKLTDVNILVESLIETL